MMTFANFGQITTKTSLAFKNNIIPQSTVVIPAVTQVIPAVTRLQPAVYKTVNGKPVLVTPAKTVVVTPAKTVILKPAQTIVTPAHEGPSGTLFSTSATNTASYGLANVRFRFLNKVLADLGPLPASFSFQADTGANAPATMMNGMIAQPFASGSFALTYTGITPLHIWASTYRPGANLLSGTFSHVALGGVVGANAGGIMASSNGGSTVDYTSDFIDFSRVNEEDFSIALTSISPVLGANQGAALHGFRASSTGLFSTQNLMQLTAVPEPASWSMMLVGFFGFGALLRRRRAAPA